MKLKYTFFFILVILFSQLYATNINKYTFRKGETVKINNVCNGKIILKDLSKHSEPIIDTFNGKNISWKIPVNSNYQSVGVYSVVNNQERFETFFRIVSNDILTCYRIDHEKFKGLDVFKLDGGMSAEYAVQKSLASLCGGVSHTWEIGPGGGPNPVLGTPDFLQKSISYTVDLYDKHIGKNNEIETVIISTGVPSIPYLSAAMNAPVLPIHFLASANSSKEIAGILDYSSNKGTPCYATLGYDASMDNVGVSWIKLLDLPKEYEEFIKRHKVKNVIIAGVGEEGKGESYCRKIASSGIPGADYVDGSIYFLYTQGGSKKDIETISKNIVDYSTLKLDNGRMLADWECGVVDSQINNIAFSVNEKTQANVYSLVAPNNMISMYDLSANVVILHIEKNSKDKKIDLKGAYLNEYLISQPIFELYQNYIPLLYWQFNSPSSTISRFDNLVNKLNKEYNYIFNKDEDNVTVNARIGKYELITELKKLNYNKIRKREDNIEELWDLKDGINSPCENVANEIITNIGISNFKKWVKNIKPIGINELSKISNSTKGIIFEPIEKKVENKSLPYLNSALSVDERVNDLLSRMTLEEKIAQVNMNSVNSFLNSKLGYGVVNAPFVGAPAVAKSVIEIKKHAKRNMRLWIPPIFSTECIHGFLSYGATIFPHALAQGSTWNTELITRMSSMIAYEASLAGIDQQLSPLFDVVRDPRYGRTEESYSEDPYLTGVIGCAYVKGTQGNPEQTKIGLPKNKLIATGKHFAGYSAPQSGINLAPASLGEREMRSIFLPPFERVVKEANIYSIMPSYNEVDGIPAHSSKFLLDQVLRKEWGFKGYVFADYGGVPMLSYYQKIAKDWKEAAKIAINTGVDVDAPGGDSYRYLLELIQNGEVKEETLDESVKRVLRIKFMAGLFEKELPDIEYLKNNIHSEKAINLAREVVEESVILLKNNGILPLKNNINNIAVIGPNANQVQYGDYSYTKNNSSGVTVFQGIKDILPEKKVQYAKGCPISSINREGFTEAIKLAKESDLVVYVMGEGSCTLLGIGWGDDSADMNGEPPTSGEGYDVTDLNPYGVQRELLQKIKETGKPVVLILIHGRPWSIEWEKNNVDAIIEAWYPGERGGEAIAKIIAGLVNPSGRLTVTIPRSVGHLPMIYNHKPSAKGFYKNRGSIDKPGRDYVFSTPDPLFCFGHGLSYSEFKYSNLKLSSKELSPNDTLMVEVNVKNISDIDGKEVVQVYINDKVSSVTTPVMELKGFDKLYIKAGETKKVKISIPIAELGLWNRDMKYVVEPGDFEVLVGRSSDNILLKDCFTVKDNKL